MKPPPPKSRIPADRPRVTVRPPRQDGDQPPGYSAHTRGSFAEAGYSTGRGTFGFQQHSH